MTDATTNLADVVADRISIWNDETKSQEDIRTIFVNNTQIKPATRVEQRVGDEIDVVLVFDGATNDQVPALSDLVEYIEQEKLGAGATVNKHYNINRTNVALIQDTDVIAKRGRVGPDGIRGARGAAGKAQVVIQEGDVATVSKHYNINRSNVALIQDTEVIAKRGRLGHDGPRGPRGSAGKAQVVNNEGDIYATINKQFNINRSNIALIQDTEVVAKRGRLGPVGVRGPRGAAGKAQNVVHEGDFYATTKSAPSIRGRQEMVLCQGDTHLSRVTKHREVNQSVVNHVETQLLNVTKHSKRTTNELLIFHEGDRTTIRNHAVNRKTVQNIEIYAPVTAYRRPKQVVDRHVNLEVFAPVFLQRNINITKVRRNIIIFTPC